MDNIELYINGSLCDTGKSFGVRLRRQMISPAELNTKDAQASYTVTLPLTKTNDRIFSYASIEETKGKFIRLNEAELIINSHRVFKGRFRITKIDKNGYTGNLVVPVAKTVKDVFGDSKLTDNTPFPLDFGDFTESVSNWNKGIYDKNRYGDMPPCIFPYVLYGLLPKIPNSVDDNTYSPRDVWDDSVRIGMQDLPPSINVLNILKHIFENRNYKLTGTAFDDIRLKSLYISYKNETDYVQPWNYGIQARMHLRGEWSNVYNKRKTTTQREFERSVYENASFDNGRSYYSTDLFNATNTKIDVVEDRGGNIIYKEVTDENARTWANTQIMIPASGFYKVQLRASFKVYDNKSWRDTDPVTGVQFVCGKTENQNNNLWNLRYEVKVLRDWRSSKFGLNAAVIDNIFFANNFPQNKTYDVDNSPKYFPQILDNNGKPCQLQFIDIAQNRNHVCGLSWGYNGNAGYNPKDTSSIHASCSVQKPSFSWDVSANETEIPRLAVNSAGFWKWGKVGKFENEEENPLPEDPEVTDVLDYELTNKHKIVLSDAPQNFARRGFYDGVAADSNWDGDGAINCVVWFNAGELITLAVTTDEGAYRRDGMHSTYGYTNCQTNFDLSIMPYRVDSEWLKVNTRGNGTQAMSWNNDINFQTDEIDLIKFLPNDVRNDEFIDNFCKAFNLKLSQTGTTEFTLDVKQTKKAQQNNFIDIDTIASVQDKANQPLGLPSAYSIGFTVNEDEEGFRASEGEDGGSTIYTGDSDGGITEQKSNFSYNWFKEIQKTESGKDPIPILLPVISKAEVWGDTIAYSEAMSKRYTNLAQRFWYFDGLLNDSGASFKFGQSNNLLDIAKVSDELPGLNTLSYKDENNTILNNYFSLLTDANSHYTLIECYLQPEQYEEIGNGAKVRFNGDLYYVADVDGYDPLNKNMTTLKLIRLI